MSDPQPPADALSSIIQAVMNELDLRYPDLFDDLWPADAAGERARLIRGLRARVAEVLVGSRDAGKLSLEGERC